MSEQDAVIEVESLKRVELVTIAGRFDSSNAGELSAKFKELTDGGRYKVVLEMSGVSYMSSAALRAVVALLRECKAHIGGDVRIAAPSERVTEVLKLAGLDALYQIYDDKTAAVGSF